jgi:uncharacterized repeat protein (TIGR02543 family)
MLFLRVSASLPQDAYSYVFEGRPGNMIKQNKQIINVTILIVLAVLASIVLMSTGCPERLYITVSYNAKGGVPAPQSVVIAVGEKYYLPDVVRIGYTFGGWATGDNGTGDLLNAKSTVEIADSHTLYARWTPIVWTITYQLYDGTNNPANPSTYTIESGNINLADASKPGSTFVGWYSDASFSNASSTISTGSTGNKTFYAKFGGPEYTVTFNPQGGTVTQTEKVVISGELFGELPVPTKDWYEFLGWYLDVNGTGGRIDYDMRVELTADTLVYAYWKQVTFTVVFDKQGGSGGTDSVTATMEEPMPQAEAPTKPGYVFGGYFSHEDGIGTKYYDANMTSTSDWNNDWWNEDTSRLVASWEIPPLVGTVGPGGGYIFYDNVAVVTEQDSSQWRYMEAAPLSAETEWVTLVGYYRMSIEGDPMLVEASGTAIGTGKSNTDLAVSKMSNGTYTTAGSYAVLVQNYAAKYCDQLVYGGKDDWFLPSKDELNWIFKQLYEKGIGDFSEANYWSSSEYNTLMAWYQCFDSFGNTYTTGKGMEYKVRPVRRFKDL